MPSHQLEFKTNSKIHIHTLCATSLLLQSAKSPFFLSLCTKVQTHFISYACQRVCVCVYVCITTTNTQRHDTARISNDSQLQLRRRLVRETVLTRCNLRQSARKHILRFFIFLCQWTCFKYQLDDLFNHQTLQIFLGKKQKKEGRNGKAFLFDGLHRRTHLLFPGR